METTFISIHDLSLDARLLYASDSVTDVLGYEPGEVVGRSCYEYFHPEDIPMARNTHERGLRLDKAAVLAYCRIRSKEDRWVACECAFTIVYDVLVASTSIYRRGPASQNRAADATNIRHLFASSPRDPRYHMLSHLSAKFRNAPQGDGFHEPRAALILNRFTRTLTILYATTALSSIIGLSPEAAVGKSFYECIQENCLQDAIHCLERAKANDSIAYMRFWYRDPRQSERQNHNTREQSSNSGDDDDGGGVLLETHMDEDAEDQAVGSDSSLRRRPHSTSQWSSSGNSTDIGSSMNTSPTFGPARGTESSSSSNPSTHGMLSRSFHQRASHRTQPLRPRPEPIEVEAVVSCTSDGLVVVLRRARPLQPLQPSAPHPYARGLFASPWAVQPLMPAQLPPEYMAYAPGTVPDPEPPHPSQGYAQPGPLRAAGPPVDDFMDSIRQVAVFAWALTGINGSLIQYTRGKPAPESLPADGLPIWNPTYRANGGNALNPADVRYGNGPSVRYGGDDLGVSLAHSVPRALWPNEPMHGQYCGQNGSNSQYDLRADQAWNGSRQPESERDVRGPAPSQADNPMDKRNRWH